ncbi:response regulator transcription factor [Domibacillus epiphyticus]|uniref:Heme response regulator HssR n=1 Tax=Domibacillus epiphyticus TaxID=1714355 RepID=A0A1V2ABD6_9BACI|nr:response regulator transcription factor [Domibacillus epiphyticus]OMP68306.1 DNA-binding response regulator [Domibacillus epiphyticus]
MKKILLVEDETYMLDLLKIHLSQEYQLFEAKDGAVAVTLIQEQSFDLVILDVMLPFVDGWTVCEKIREKDDTPILMLTARTEVGDRVKGLEIGADDYLVKPFDFEELVARVRALLRRSEQVRKRNEDQRTKFLNGRFIVDNESRQIMVNQHLIEFTAKEFDLLSLLASHPQRVFTRDILLDQIWDHDEVRDLRIVDTHIKNIRTKLKNAEANHPFIKTVWGVGYTLNIQEDNR